MNTKNIVIYALIIALLLNVIYLFNEFRYFNLSRAFDSVKFQTVLQIIGIVINCLTIYFLLLQSKELENSRNETVKARISQRRPELFPQELLLETQDDINPVFFMNGLENPYTPKFYQYENYVQRQSSDVTIGNAGLGPAINLTIEWIFDENEVKNFVGDVYNTNQKIEKVATTLFIAQDKNYQATLPYLYLILYGQKLNHPFVSERAGKPKLQLRLTYCGTFYEPYTKLFNVNFNVIEKQFFKINFTLESQEND